MNSLKTMAKNEDEVQIIASIYSSSINSFFKRGSCNINPRSFLYVYRVDEALNLLDEHSREVINNDFIEFKPNWWKAHYPNKLYLHMRAKAVNSFLRLFYGY